MIIYGAFLIPFLVSIVLYKFYKKKTLWWELMLPILVSFILIFSTKALIEKVNVQSVEYWGSLVARVDYEEEWDEWIVQTCTTTNCDSEGKNCVTTSYDCSYRSYHPPRWFITTTIGETINISQSEYEKIKNKLGNSTFLDMNRDFYRIDGNRYYSQYLGDSALAVPVSTTRNYENRVKKADQSVFHFQDVTKEEVERYQLKQYPKITAGYKMDAVLGDESADAMVANEKVQYLNGLLGHAKQVRCFVLVFKNQPIEASFYQEWLWSGGNMNEFVVCIGIDNSRQVKWCKSISWTPNEYLKTRTKTYIEQMDTLNLTAVASYLQAELGNGFVRRDFEEFNYLTVEPPLWGIILVYLLTIGINIILACWVVKNDHESYGMY